MTSLIINLKRLPDISAGWITWWTSSFMGVVCSTSRSMQIPLFTIRILEKVTRARKTKHTPLSASAALNEDDCCQQISTAPCTEKEGVCPSHYNKRMDNYSRVQENNRFILEDHLSWKMIQVIPTLSCPTSNLSYFHWTQPASSKHFMQGIIIEVKALYKMRLLKTFVHEVKKDILEPGATKDFNI